SGLVAEADAKLSTLVGKLVLTVVDGDRQRAAEGKPLPQPLMLSAWIAGKRAAGLPLAAAVEGGRAAPAVVSPEGRAEVRVEDVGRFAKAEQQIQVGVDWARLAGASAPWMASAPRGGVTATALRKGLDTTRVLVL